MIGAWHHVIGGFRQGRRTPNGNETLWIKLRQLSNRDTSVQMWDWDTDWDAIAAFVLRTSRPDPAIYVYGYSWGGGWGFVRFAAGLRARPDGAPRGAVRRGLPLARPADLAAGQSAIAEALAGDRGTGQRA
ncbi:MAG: hypothetical protein H0V62_15395 [Gammaproteobacteria bacterium]|nr:hypothetical protein [Gammaproteobacteria bacterium]